MNKETVRVSGNLVGTSPQLDAILAGASAEPKRYPGKMEGCADQELGETLYQLTLDGAHSEELGDVQDFGWFGKLNLADKFYVVWEDSQGFFDYTEYDTAAERDSDWSKIETEYEEFCNHQECEA